ncbi:hypothetical protein ABT160_05870 [Streptomyces sp. NPDC001941]|uniref:hypothetical protein n=1 Tax=Streptomyces sp. NPDC001941 TaxID=3154659 RepID=UPI0033231EAD
MTTGDTHPHDDDAAPDEPAPPPGAHLTSHHGPSAHQYGDHNTQHVHFHSADDGEPPTALDALADRLEAAVRTQWRREAQARRLYEPAPLPLRWRVSGRDLGNRADGSLPAADGHTRFRPLPGLPPVTRATLRAGGGQRQLHDVYGGLASGRLLLVGAPGCGKTTSAVLLLLDALEHRAHASPRDRARIPVPVMVTLQGWNPHAQTAVRWLAEKLTTEYRLSRGPHGSARAERLLASGRIAVILDGLDEVAGVKLRAAMLKALAPAPFRIVLVSRATEAVLTSKRTRTRLAGAVALEIDPVPPAVAVDYLLDQQPDPAPPPWRRLAGHLLRDEPEDPVREALASPFALRLVHDVYGGGDAVDELLDRGRFPGVRDVEDHLLDHLVTAAYTVRPGHPPPRYSVPTAVRTLRYVARRLDQEGTRDLTWWHIPSWIDRRRNAALVALCAAVVFVPVYAFILGAQFAHWWGPWAGVGIGLVNVVTVLLRLSSFDDVRPLETAGWRDIFHPSSLRFGFFACVVPTLLLWLASPMPLLGVAPPPFWACAAFGIAYGFGSVLVGGGAHELVSGSLFAAGPSFRSFRTDHGPAPELEVRAIGPREIWRHHLGLRLVLGVGVGLASTLAIGAAGVCWVGLVQGTLMGAGFGIWNCLWSGPLANLAVHTMLASAQLSRAEGTPVHLMAFLEDAHRRNLLRTVGPVYQFRHVKLQRRVARAEPEPAGGGMRVPYRGRPGHRDGLGAADGPSARDGRPGVTS